MARNVKDIREPRAGRWVRFKNRKGETVVGRVVSVTVDGSTLDSGEVFSYAKGDRLEWYSATAPDADISDPNVDVLPRVANTVRRRESFRAFHKIMLAYCVLVSTAVIAAVAYYAYPLLK